MNTEVRGIHLDVSEKIKEHIEKKLHKIDFAKEYIIDLLFTLAKEKHGHKVEVTINFRWGYSAHVSVESFDILEGINKLIDKIESKVNKEKNKIQEHHHHHYNKDKDNKE